MVSTYQPNYLLAEITRSASEASKITLKENVDLNRYLNPSADTCYPLEYAFHILGDVHGKLVLDLGCGSGEEIVSLRQRGARVIGIDISPDLIAIARQRLQMYGMKADLRIASAYDTGLADESVDVVFSMSILHHLELDRVKKEIRRILKPDGVLIFKEPVRFAHTMKQLRRLFPASGDISAFEYPLNSAQLQFLVQGFEVLSSRSFRTPLVPLVTRTLKLRLFRRHIWSCDAWILKHFPRLEHFATSRVMALKATKSASSAGTTRMRQRGVTTAIDLSMLASRH